MTKIWTRMTNTGQWELYGEVRHDEVTYHCRKILEMTPGAYIKTTVPTSPASWQWR